MEEPHLKTHRHLKFAQLLIVVAIGINLAMFMIMYSMLTSQITNVESKVKSDLTALDQKSVQGFQTISTNLSSLSTGLEQSADSLDYMNSLLEQLGERIRNVSEESQAGIQSIKSEINYTGTINNAMESVVLIIWTDKESIVGSGFFVSEDGYILTANHVVDSFDGKTVRVKTKNGTVYTATVEEQDEDSDVAVLRVPVTGVDYLELGDSDNLPPGSKVFALGAPEGFAFSATEGIVSAVRSVNDIQRDVGLDLELGQNIKVVQTDASITHGNSGGPLIDKAGNAVGVNSFGISRGSGSDSRDIAGLNFAISSNDAEEVLASVL